jgi:histidinol-phosphatase
MPSPSSAEYLAFLLDVLPLLRSEISAVRQSGLNSEVKSDGSWVTAADRATEKKFRELVAAKFPSHGVLGEEYGLLNPDADYRWVIDPIDGTAEFRAAMPEWGTVIGLFEKETPIAGLIDCFDLDLLSFAAKGAGAWLERDGVKQRIVLNDLPEELPAHKIRCGLSPLFSFQRFGTNRSEAFHQITESFTNQRMMHNCYIHNLVFSGALDLSIEWRVRLWDIASLQLITEEAGGKFVICEKYMFEGDEIYSVVYGRPALVDKALRIIDAKAG